MERLTERAEVDKCPGIWVKEEFANEGLRTWFNGYDEGYSAINKCAEYEDLEEQGLLLKLPCKVGDTLYRIDTDEKIENAEIEYLTIENIVICEDGEVLFKYDAYDGVICDLKSLVNGELYLDFYRVFLTQAEAEEVLKRIFSGKTQ